MKNRIERVYANIISDHIYVSGINPNSDFVAEKYDFIDVST